VTDAPRRPESVVLSPAEHAVLAEAEFGAPGLVAVESIGPFTRENMPIYAEGAGAVTREMVGSHSPLPVFSDIRLFTDTTLPAGAAVDWLLGEGEGGLLSVREGRITRAGRPLGRRYTALVPPGPSRTVTLSSGPGARVIRANFGPGHGLVLGT